MTVQVHPYQDLPEDQYWTSGMVSLAPGLLNPARPHAKKISCADKIVTLGSCFAQHIGQNLQRAGYNYFVSEPAPSWMVEDYAIQHHYGVYSARYGNIYTPRQALQLIGRAYDRFKPIDQYWQDNGTDLKWFDPFRPHIQPGGFSSIEALVQDRESHLCAVRAAFEGADWFILTLGLTEAWQNRHDGAILPIAPGVLGGTYDPERYTFVNFTVAQMTEDLVQLRQALHAINPGARLILTVSPVALAATYEPRHVWTSTTYSKAVLRVAAESLTQQFDNVSYFPAYEIVTSPLNASRYFEDDMRQVNAQGVAHVMRAFFETYTEATPLEKIPSIAAHLAKDMQVVCDESNLDVSAQKSIFDEAAYLDANPDVAEFVIKGIIQSGAWHYAMYGRFEGRSLTKQFPASS